MNFLVSVSQSIVLFIPVKVKRLTYINDESSVGEREEVEYVKSCILVEYKIEQIYMRESR